MIINMIDYEYVLVVVALMLIQFDVAELLESFVFQLVFAPPFL